MKPTPEALLQQIQDALVDAFYDPDPADPTPEVDYAVVDWVGVIRDVRRLVDTLKEGHTPVQQETSPEPEITPKIIEGI